MTSPKILFLDIETAPLLSYTWGTFDQNVALNQIVKDWAIISWSAKWKGDKKILYQDVRAQKDKYDDKKILKGIWKLIDDADILVTQNGKSFDLKKLNARFLKHKFQPPSSYQHIDTLRLAKKHFSFTSNKLEYMTNEFNVEFKKLKHEKFGGFELWKQCLAGNRAAWKEMEKYNKHDVLALEELYEKLIAWDGDTTMPLFTEDGIRTCSCGSKDFQKYGFHLTKAGRKQRYRCTKCGSQYTNPKAVKHEA